MCYAENYIELCVSWNVFNQTTFFITFHNFAAKNSLSRTAHKKFAVSKTCIFIFYILLLWEMALHRCKTWLKTDRVQIADYKFVNTFFSTTKRILLFEECVLCFQEKRFEKEFLCFFNSAHPVFYLSIKWREFNWWKFFYRN